MSNLTCKLAMFIPEWPGQTHIFFWREMNALREIGIEPNVISTRRPSANVICHEWSEKAMRDCIYLMPLSATGLMRGLWELIRSGPIRLTRCSRVILTAGDASWMEKLKALTMLPIAGQLISIIRHNKFTHLHAHSCGNAAMLAMMAHLLGNIDYSLTLHSALPTFGGYQEAKWRHARFGTTVTNQLKQDVLRHCRGLQPNKISVAPMGVDLAVFHRDQPYEPPRPGEPWKLVSCGRLHRGKGHQDVIRAVAMIHESGQPVHLTILGEGPERENLQQLIKDLRAETLVTLAGSVSEIQVRDTLAASHLFVLGSHDEAIGVATMEAMAMGLPVVVTDVGGVKELVRDGVDGWLTSPQDTESMASIIQEVLKDSEETKRFSESAEKRIHEQFTSDRSATLIKENLSMKSQVSHVQHSATERTCESS
ncbi:MAG: exopolysaccharide biosynthesis GT4 family glycosyltransferase EpsE [Pirellula sp.]